MTASEPLGGLSPTNSHPPTLTHHVDGCTFSGLAANHRRHRGHPLALIPACHATFPGTHLDTKRLLAEDFVKRRPRYLALAPYANGYYYQDMHTPPAFASVLVIVPSLSDAHSPPRRPHAHPVTPRRPTPQFTKTHHADHISTHHPRKSFFRPRGPLSSVDSYPLERIPVSELLSQRFTLCPPLSSQRPYNASDAEGGRQVRKKREREKQRRDLEWKDHGPILGKKTKS